MIDAARNLKSQIKPNNTLNINFVLVAYIIILLSPPPLPTDKLYKFPFSAMDYIKENAIEGNVYSPWTWSGYITWKTDKKCQVFLDTRIEPFDRELIEMHFSVFRNPIPYFDQIKEMHTKYILYPSDLGYKKMLYFSKINKTSLLYQDDHSFLMELPNE